MAMVETTFTVQTQTWVNPGESQVRIDYIRTWRELYRQIANAGIGWTLAVTTDTLDGKNGGTFAGKMYHTATGIHYSCFASTASNLQSNSNNMYTTDGKFIGRCNSVTPLYYNPVASSQNTYFVDSINGGIFQECRVALGSSLCMWRVAQGELIDGTNEGYAGYTTSEYTDSTSSIIATLRGYSDLTGNAEEIDFKAIYGWTGSASQLYMSRCYGIRTGQTSGVTMTWGGKKLFKTGYNLIPRANYSINGTRYTALSANILLEE